MPPAGGAAEAQAEVDSHLLGTRRYTSTEIVRTVGIPMYRARRFWRSLGFPNVAQHAVEFTDADAEALRSILRLSESAGLDESMVVQLLRSLGQAATRLADSHADLAGRGIDIAGINGPDRIDAVQWLVRAVLPDLEKLLVYAWHRHLASATTRLADAGAPAACAAIGFADMAGFTSLSRQLELPILAQLVERFESQSADTVTHSGARIIKAQGDSIMFVADTVSVAARTATALLDANHSDPGLPRLRIGVAFGPVIFRMGDVFGATVNLASRLTASAEPGSILVDTSIANVLCREGYELERMPSRDLRGFGPFVPHKIGRGAVSGATSAPDPVR